MSSQARSGCGIRPATLRCSLQIPAMLRREPLGLASSVNSPRRLQYCTESAATTAVRGASRGRQSSTLRRGRSDLQQRSRRDAAGEGRVVVGGFEIDCSQRNWSERLRISAPAGVRLRKGSENRCRRRAPGRRPPRTPARLHDRAEPGNRATAQVVAVTETPGMMTASTSPSVFPCARSPRFMPHDRTAWTQSWSQFEAGTGGGEAQPAGRSGGSEGRLTHGGRDGNPR